MPNVRLSSSAEYCHNIMNSKQNICGIGYSCIVSRSYQTFRSCCRYCRNICNYLMAYYITTFINFGCTQIASHLNLYKKIYVGCRVR